MDIFRSSQKLQNAIDAAKSIAQRISRSTRLRELIDDILKTDTVRVSIPTPTRYEHHRDLSELPCS